MAHFIDVTHQHVLRLPSNHSLKYTLISISVYFHSSLSLLKSVLESSHSNPSVIWLNRRLLFYQFEMIRVCDGLANSTDSYFSGSSLWNREKHKSNGAGYMHLIEDKHIKLTQLDDALWEVHVQPNWMSTTFTGDCEKAGQDGCIHLIYFLFVSVQTKCS